MRDAESIVSDREGFKSMVIAKLHEHPGEFLKNHRYIKDRERRGERYQTSGVILLLQFSEERGQYEFVLTKRSHYVVQPGDLCCPGGHVSPHDKIHGFFISRGLSPLTGSHVLRRGKKSEVDEIKVIADYLSTALREAKEETGLPLKSVEYLGSLPPYGLISFNRVIYPLVGLVIGKWKRRLNWEVEKIVTIGLREMLHPEHYFWMTFFDPEENKESSQINGRNFPSFVSDDGGQKEILWGATFNIIQSFLRIVLNFTLPHIPPDKVVYKEIPESYFTGNFQKLPRKGFKRYGGR